MPQSFLPAWVYGSAEIAALERERYAPRWWHPLSSSDRLAEGQVQAFELLELPILLTRLNGVVRAFLNRCPHRGVPLHPCLEEPRACRRLVCPYHGWTYSLDGVLLAAAREQEFMQPFRRDDWPLPSLLAQELGGLIWVALGPDPYPLHDQLDLVLQEAGALLQQPRRLLARERRELHCNWKIAHDNTLDDYHVAIAHPRTLHPEQGPVRHYRHALSAHANLLATPHRDGGSFLTFGLAPWTHLLLWPDGRMALIQFVPLALDRCSLEVWLLGDGGAAAGAVAWMEEVQAFLEEDRQLVEAAQRGYASGLQPGPPHRLEQRILQHQSLYARMIGLNDPEHPAAATGPSRC